VFLKIRENYTYPPFEVQLHSKQSSIVKIVKVPAHSVNNKHPNEDNEETIHRICKVEDND